MKIKSLHIQNFTVFEGQTLDFCDGINVFIGANSTGKTHALKAMYWLLSTPQDELQSTQGSNVPRSSLSSFLAIFRPSELNPLRLTRDPNAHLPPQTPYNFLLSIGDQCIHGEIGLNSVGWGGTYDPGSENPLFIPPREMLSVCPGFVAAWDKRESGFDKTYRNICVSLDLEPLKEGGLSPESASLIAALTEILGGPVKRDERGFYIELPDGKWLEAHLMAEGHRKLAMLVRLIANGEIAKDTILFWDEPESSMNPRLITLVAKVIRQLAAAGVQIFLATHDYLLTGELSLAAECEKDDPPTRFFAFYRPEEDPLAPVSVEVGDTIANLQHNLIVEEFAAHYDRGREAFYRRANAEEK